MNKFVLSLSLFTFISLSAFSQAIDLKFNLLENETYVLEINVNQQIKQVIMGNEQVITNDLFSELTFEVLEKRGDYVVTEVAYTDMNLILKLPQTTLEMDSKKDTASDNPMAGMLKGLLNKPFTLTFNSLGNVTDAEGIENIFEGMFENVDLQPQAKQQLSESIRQSFGEKGIVQNFEMLTSVYPEGPVKPGDSWNDTLKVQSMIAMMVENTYTLSEATEEHATIGIQSQIKSESEQDFQNMGGMPIKYDLKGNLSGHYILDIKTGWFTGGEVLQNISGDVQMDSTPQMPDGMEWPIEIATTINYLGKRK